jgi:cyclophilin family peptidyl-prolyl cis-trans isomerase
MNRPLTSLLSAAALVISTGLQAQDAAALDKAPEAAADAAARALELVKQKGGDIGKELEKAAPELAKQIEEAPKALKASGAMPIPKKAPEPKRDDPSTWSKNSVRKLAVMDIEFGQTTETIMFELFEKDAPRTVANFIDNCESNAYAGLAVHRAIDNYLVQTGDPLSADTDKRSDWGTGGNDRKIPGEFKRPHVTGCVAMARLGDKVNPKKESNGYQFYFGLGNMSSLSGNYTVFGQVVSGLEALQQISQAPADANDCPLQRIAVKSIKVIDQKGPLLTLRTRQSNSFFGDGKEKRKYTKPLAARTGLDRLLERIW